MPYLPDPVSQPNIKTFYLPKPDKDENGQDLPQDKRAWVKMDMQPTTGGDITSSLTNVDDPFGMFLVRRIVEWNFIEHDGTPTPITYQNVLRMGKENIIFLAQQPIGTVEPLDDEQKKTSTSTSMH